MKELIALHKIKNKAIEYYKQAKATGQYEDIEMGITLLVKDGQISEYSIIDDVFCGGIVLHVYQPIKTNTNNGICFDDIVVIQLNKTASKYKPFEPSNNN